MSVQLHLPTEVLSLAAGLSLLSVEAVTHLVSPGGFWPLAELAAAFLAIPSSASPLPLVG